ncbi:MAG: TldD/PmbA family protein [Bacilli bacterium]
MNSKDFIKLCQENGINDVEIMITKNYSVSLEAMKDSIEKDQTIDITSYLIKAKYFDNIVTLSSEMLDESLIFEIKELSKYTEKKITSDFASQIDIHCDLKLEKRNLFDYKQKLIEIATKQLEKHQEIKNIVQNLEYNSFSKQLINSNGVDIESSSSYYVYSIESTASDGNNNTCEWKIFTLKDENELDIEKFANEIIEKNLLHLNEKNIKSGTYRTLFAPNVVADIVKYLLSMLNGDNINRNISMLQNHLNEKMYSGLLTIIDDATDIKAPCYRIFDDEGTKTKKNILVENGIVKTFLHNKNSAASADTLSTGNGYHDTIDCRNVSILPGTKNKEELLSSIDKGIYVTELMISSSALNIGTGIYSGSIMGFLIENGQIKHAIKNVIINTNLNDILNNIIEIGDNLEYSIPSIKTPYLLVDNIVFTGAEENEN